MEKIQFEAIAPTKNKQQEGKNCRWKILHLVFRVRWRAQAVFSAFVHSPAAIFRLSSTHILLPLLSFTFFLGAHLTLYIFV